MENDQKNKIFIVEAQETTHITQEGEDITATYPVAACSTFDQAKQEYDKLDKENENKWFSIIEMPVDGHEEAKVIYGSSCYPLKSDIGAALKYMEPTPENILTLIHMSAKVLEALEDQDPEICMQAVRIWPSALRYIKDQTPEVCIEAIKGDPYAVQYVRDQTDEICIAAAERGAFISPKYFKNMSEPVCIAAAEHHGPAWLEYLPEQYWTKKVCLAAAQASGYALRFMPDHRKTHEVCLAAVKNEGECLRYVPSDMKTKDICLAAIQEDSKAVRYVEKPDEEIYMAAVKRDPYAFFYVPEPTSQLGVTALSLVKERDGKDALPDFLEQGYKVFSAFNAWKKEYEDVYYIMQHEYEKTSGEILPYRRSISDDERTYNARAIGRRAVNGSNRIDTSSKTPKSAEKKAGGPEIRNTQKPR